MALVHAKDWGKVVKAQADITAEKLTANPEFAEAHFQNGDEILTGNEGWERDIAAFNKTTKRIHNLFKSFLLVVFTSLALFCAGVTYLFI